MKKNIEKALIFAISVLTAKVVAEKIFKLLIGYRDNVNPYVSTALGMLIILLVFTPILTFMNQLLSKVTKSYLKVSKKVAKKSHQGLYVGACIAIVILYFIYLNSWYHINIITKVKQIVFD